MRALLWTLPAVTVVGGLCALGSGSTCCFGTAGPEYITTKPVRRLAPVTSTLAPPRVAAVRWQPMELDLDTVMALPGVFEACPPIVRLELVLAPEDAARDVGYVVRGAPRVDESPSHLRPLPAAGTLKIRLRLSELLMRTTPLALTVQAVDRAGALGPPSAAIEVSPLPRLRAKSRAAAWTSFILGLPLVLLLLAGRGARPRPASTAHRDSPRRPAP